MVLSKKDKINLLQLKKLCKVHKIKKYSKLTKHEILKLLNLNISIVKIQRHFRNKWIKECCPVSLETVRFPCFPFRPKGFGGKYTFFIYYNLKSLVDYLIISGDFRDPKTREPYSEHVLKSIDKCRKKVGMKGKSVYHASKNTSYYRKKREKDEDIVVFERFLDEIVSSIRNMMETPQTSNPTNSLNNYHLPIFHRYFKSMYYKSKENAKYFLSHTIHVISGTKQRCTPDPNGVKSLILQFLYTVESLYIQ